MLPESKYYSSLYLMKHNVSSDIFLLAYELRMLFCGDRRGGGSTYANCLDVSATLRER